jgi:hypothetical protein
MTTLPTPRQKIKPPSKAGRVIRCFTIPGLGPVRAHFPPTETELENFRVIARTIAEANREARNE